MAAISAALLLAAFSAVAAYGAPTAPAADPAIKAKAANPPSWTYSPEPVGPWEPLPVQRSHRAPERADVSLAHGSRPIPRSFFGIAVEYNELPDYEAEGSLFDRVLSLMQPQDGSRLVLRVGGESGDLAYWKPSARGTPPKGVFSVDDQWMSGLAALVRHDRLRVMLGLNLAVHSPAMAVDLAQAALDTLPRNSLLALLVGNEPDLYHLEPWLRRQRISTTVRKTSHQWTVDYSPADYRRDYREYVRALVRKVPGVPLAGPETGASNLVWVQELAGLGPESPALITSHRYPSSTCAPPLSVWYPSMRSFLGDGGSAGLAKTVTPTEEFARQRHVRSRISEMNTVSCGGVPGVTDAFATALWAADALFQMVNTGTSGVNWETRPGTANAPFHPTAGGIQPLPELYGLATFAQMIGRRPRLLATNVTGPTDLHLSAWAVKSADATRILVINRNPRAVATTLHLGQAANRATVRWLLAPAANSSSRITLGGQTIGSDARWHGRARHTVTRRRGGTYTLTVPGYSAALLTFPSS